MLNSGQGIGAAMKEFATLETNDIGRSNSVSFSSRKRFPGYASLDELTEEGWRVVASGVQPGSCAHPQVRFIFVLERECDITE